MAEPAVAAIVVNWRLADATLRCVADLAACGYPRLRILAIDNGSGPEVAGRLAAGLGEAADSMMLEHNVGYCAAVNLGLRWARDQGAELALLVNNDVRLPEGFLQPLAEAMANDPDLACVGPTMVRPDGLVWCEGGVLAFAPNLARLRRQGRPPRPLEHGPEPVDFVPGACALYRLADLAAVGDLEESYFMYWEDVELGLRLRALGKKIVWLPWTRVVHDVSASSGGGRTRLRRYLCALNQVRFLRRHGRPHWWAALLLCDLLGWPLGFLSGDVATTWAKARGLFDGLCGGSAGADVVERLAAGGRRLRKAVRDGSQLGDAP